MHHLRRATAADAEGVRKVYLASWTHLAREVLGLTGERYDPRDAVLAPTFVACGGADPGAPVLGFCQITAPWLHRLYVDPAHHGTGIGSDLLRAGVDAGARLLWVDEANAPARSFYERAGWAPDGVADPGLNWPEHRVLRYCSSVSR